MKATIIIPTTADRGPLLPFSVGSVLNQTIQDAEIFIIGDGVYQNTREIIQDLQSKDCRIKFFDHPKGPRRGEIYRHQALQEASGHIVCYLCDRDLMLPNHLEVKLNLHEDYNFISSAYIDVALNGDVKYGHKIKYYGPGSKLKIKKLKQGNVPLSCASHTLKLYHNLPHGWRTAPRNEYTDRYMWKQILVHPGCKAYSSIVPTILYFHRNHHPGWPVKKRLPELKHWYEFIQSTSNIDQLKEDALAGLLEERADLQDAFFLFKGFRLKEIPKRIMKEVNKYAKRFLNRQG